MPQSLVDAKPEQIVEVVTTNLLGSLLATRAAIQLMGGQATAGHVFNVDGAGADGSPTPQYAAYGATKSGEPTNQVLIWWKGLLVKIGVRITISHTDCVPSFDVRLKSVQHADGSSIPSTLVASSVSSSHVFCAAGIAHMMGSLKAELQAAGSSVSVHTISPGMVLTGDVHSD